MTVQYIGSRTLGGAVPGVAAAAGIASASVSAALAELNAKLTGLLKVQVSLAIGPPQLGATITAAIKQVASLQLMVGGPTFTPQVAAVGAAVLAIGAQVAALEAQLAIVASLTGSLGAAGVHGWVVSGQAGAVGPELASAVGAGPPGGSPSDTVGGILLLASSAETVAAMGRILPM